MWNNKLLAMSLFAVATTLAGCLESGDVKDNGTNVNFQPPPENTVCNPFGSDPSAPPQYGVKGSLYYKGGTDPNFTSVEQYFSDGNLVENIVLFFNQLVVPTRPFDRGFTTVAGQPIVTPEGHTLYEWFAIKFNGKLVSSESFAPGYYEMGILSDDGAILKVDLGSGMQTLINNDGNHPTRMGCTTTPVYIDANIPLPFELAYNQGPRYHISLIVMMRPWLDSNRDPLCGQQGNSLYFDSTQDPPAPMPAWTALQSRGWRPLSQTNYLMPTGETNPCAEQPTPVISNTNVINILTDGATVVWNTDIPANSRVIYVNKATGLLLDTPADANYVTNHSVDITGLASNTVYGVTAVSTSSGGQVAQSPEVLFRTARP